VRYVGEVSPSRDPEFKEFQSMAHGYRAMFVLVDSYRRRYGLNTIRTMINRYAPPSENFTDGYIRFITSCTGISADEPLDTQCASDMIPVVAAMSKIENGVSPDIWVVKQGWQMFKK
jgi:hypothetical protein